MILKAVNPVVHAALPYAMRPVWWWVRIARSVKRRFAKGDANPKVLLVCQNTVAADHLRSIAACLQENSQIRLFCTNDHFPAQEIGKGQIKRSLGVPYRNVLWALLCDWDLVVYVNHPWGFGSWFPPFLKKVYVNHGLYSGKINNPHGEDGLYGRRRTTREHRGLLYDRMFVASRSERAAALSADPGLSGVLVVTGSLIVDELQVAMATRDQVRERLGLRPRERVVHVISTWGAASLAATLGDSLLEACAALGGSYRFLFSLHPRFDKFGGVPRTRGEILREWASRGIEVDIDNSRWKEFVVAADIAIADNSSLALYHHVLSRPIIFVPVAEGAFLPGTAFDVVRRGAARLDNVADFEVVLAGALAAGPEAQAAISIDHLVECRGNAKLRHMEEIELLLRNSDAG